MKPTSIVELRVQRQQKLQELAKIQPFIAGSLVPVRVRCGKPGCHCVDGERHEAVILTKKVKGKSTSIHVPRAMLAEVEAWQEEHKRIKKLMREISALGEKIIRLHVRTVQGKIH